MLRRPATVSLLVGAVISVAVVLLSWATGVPGGERPIGAIVDASLPATFPTWWSTASFTAAGLAHATVAVLARRTGSARALPWAIGAVAPLLLSMAEHTAVVARLGSAAAALVANVVLAGVLLAAAPTGRRPGFLVIGGAGLVLASLGGADLLARVMGEAASARSSALLHAAELAENLGALLLLAGAAAALGVRREAGTLFLAVRGRAAGSATGAEGRSPRLLLVVGTGALSAASLGAVLALTAPDLHEIRLFLDVLVEDNLPTWWSAALLLTAAIAHAAVAVVGSVTGNRAAWSWFGSAVVLVLLSLDDHTQLHERTETLGRLVMDGGSYPFLWLLPGAVAGAAVAWAMCLTAVRAPRRARRLLISGVGVLLFCALGLEFVQGFYMAAGDEGLPFVLTYHVEELGENVAALLMLAAAAAALHVSRGDGELAVRSVRDDAGRRTSPEMQGALAPEGLQFRRS